ncbi:MAG: PAS domain-containing protein, partial [Acidobacteria bacterium]|nr:PAS domain-containing protein [Acidobacteriota bacterium]
ALQAEVLERQRVENALRQAHDELEVRVAERTQALADANEVLQREITERRRTGEALKNSRALYHSLVENLPVNIWRTDAAGRFTFANGHLCHSLGVTEEETLGKTAGEFFTTATAERSARTDRQVMEGGHAFEGIEEFETRAGRTGYVQILKTPFHDSKGRMLGIQGISWDVTERKRAEEEMRRIQGQVERTNSDLRRKNEEMRLLAGDHWQEHDLVFPSHTGTPLDERNTLSRFHALLASIGLPKIRLYDLRHTQASLLIAEGKHPKLIAERLGHSSIKLTMDTYGHLFPGADESSAHAMNQLFSDAYRKPHAPLQIVPQPTDVLSARSKRKQSSPLTKLLTKRAV